MSKARRNYNKKYFKWYKKIGEFGGKINKSRFEKYIKKKDKVLDFGCGGGYLLSELNCKEKHGVEFNPVAIKNCRRKNIKIYKDTKKLKKNYFDKIISNNSLQHCEDPFLEIKNLHQSLKKNGLIIIVTACASRNHKYFPKDINYQMYSWSPMNLGNFLENCGFKILLSKTIIYRWPPFYEFIYKIFGLNTFNVVCKIFGLLDSSLTSIIAVGKK